MQMHIKTGRVLNYKISAKRELVFNRDRPIISTRPIIGRYLGILNIGRHWVQTLHCYEMAIPILSTDFLILDIGFRK